MNLSLPQRDEPTGELTTTILGPVLSCPYSTPFLPRLAEAVLRGEIWRGKPPSHAELSRLTIFVPSQNAVLPLTLAFLVASNRDATLLPAIRVLGECDPVDDFARFCTGANASETALALLADAIAVAPPFDRLERELSLTALALEVGTAFASRGADFGEPLFPALSPAAAFALAKQLASFIDEIQADGFDLGHLDRLQGLLLDGPEQLSLQFALAVLTAWRSQRLAASKLDRERRRAEAMSIQARMIAASSAPVIIAGTTGSIVATAELARAVLSRPQGALVLQGLDGLSNDQEWAAIEPHPEHPQWGLFQFLKRLSIPRSAVRNLAASAAESPRARLLREALRPAISTRQWPIFIERERDVIQQAISSFSLIEAANIQEEAEIIALILREAVEDEKSTACVVTPDDALRERIRYCLIGRGFREKAQTAKAEHKFAARVAACAASRSAEDFVALLKHAPGADASVRRLAELIDLGALRQIWRPKNTSRIVEALRRAAHESRAPQLTRMSRQHWQSAMDFAEAALEALAAFGDPAELRPFQDWVSRHEASLSRLASIGLGARARDIIDVLRNAGGKPFALDLEGYAALVAQILSERVFQEEPQLHPRIRLLSPLSARLLSADIMILAGLNEGCWPARVEADSWLGRSQRGLLGLPPLERRAGQAAADFMSFASAGRCVYLTRSRTSDGSMTRPSRWIARLSALVSGASLAIDRGARWFELLQAGAKTAQPIEPPAPRPPLAARPRRLSVTAVESWLANPYAIYARHILKLDPLRGFHEGAGPRERGILLHDALHSFFRDTSVTASLDSDRLMACYIRAAEEAGLDLNSAPFWALRFRRFADWFVESERERRKGVSDVRTEIPAKLMLTLRIGSTFDLTARIDRIDLREDSSAIIYDYKTSNSAGDKGSKRGAPQLALEAYLLREGAVAGLSGAAEIAFSYIIATGGEPPGKLVQPKGNSADLIAAAQVGLKKLIERFDDEATPYTFAQRPIFKDKAAYDVYAHLARVKEWGGTSDEAADD